MSLGVNHFNLSTSNKNVPVCCLLRKAERSQGIFLEKGVLDVRAIPLMQAPMWSRPLACRFVPETES